MFSIAAINDSDSKNQWEPLAPTKEAQEFRLTQTYQEGLLQLHAGEYLKAESLFEAVIQDPLIASAELENNASDGHMLQLRFLALKNLANVFAQQGPLYYEKAVQCYLQAVEIDGKDIVVWNRLGTLSCALGSLNIARRAFEQGLNCSPNNWNCMEKLLEVLIAIGDEVACLTVAKLLLKSWPSHSRASLVKSVIEESCTVPFGIRGIDKLEPEHISLSFPRKREAQDVEENEDHPKKKKVQNLDLNLPEASWGALVDAILDTLKSKPSNNSNGCNVDSEEAGHHSDMMNKKLINANVIFFVRGARISEMDTGSPILKMLQCAPGVGRNKDAEVNVSAECISEAVGEPCRDAGSGTHGICRDGSFNDNSNERTSIMKEREVSTDEEPPQERRSTRLERLRSRKSEREESDLEKGKEHAKLLRQMLDPYIVCDEREIKSSNSAIKYSAKIDRNTDSSNCDESDVMKFLITNASNNGIYDIGKLLLEKMSVSSLPYWNGQYGLLELDKLTRHWNQDRTPFCNLFLAELYSDFALSCTEESKVTDLFNEASYHLCKVVESFALRVPFHNFLSVQNAGDMSKNFSQLNYSCEIGLKSECGTDDKNMVDTHCSFSGACMMSTTLTGTDNSTGASHETGQMSGTNDSDPTFDWSFWVRFHWLSGRLWTFSGEREKGLKEFQRCFSLLNSSPHVNGSGTGVILPYCKIDKEISLERVCHELRLLEVEGLLKRSSAQMLEKGKYSDLIKLLSPVLLVDNERCIVQTWGVNKGHALDTSVELTALDILISACEKANPMDLAISLKCHKRRLEIICLAAGIGEMPVAGDVTDKTLVNNLCNPGSELEQDEARKGQDWSKMVAEEVKSISRCASRIKEEIEECEPSASFEIQATLLGQIQYLLLTIMCHIIRAFPCLRSAGLASLDPSEQLESSCFVDAAVAFCKLQHLDSSISVKKQVGLLVIVHELLAEHGLCCAGKDCEGGEGTFLKLAIKHLLALEIKLKTSLNVGNCPGTLRESSKQHSENVHVLDVFPKASTANQIFDGHVYILHDEENKTSESAVPNEIMSVSSSGTEVVGKAESILDRGKTCADIGKVPRFERKKVNTGVGDGGDHLSDVERKKVELGMDNVLDQSFFCLYGLNLKCGLDTSSEDDLAVHRNTSLGDYQTKEQCADVFQYLLPYAKASSRAGLVKLRKVLRAIRKQFPQPPEEVLTGNPLDSFLDDPEFNEEKLRNMAISGENVKYIIKYAFGAEPSCDNDQVTLTGREWEMHHMSLMTGKIVDASSEQYLEVYGSLYYILAQVEEMSATDKWPGFVLTKEGEEFVQQNANLFKYDLLYNPLRFESWQKLANIYDEEVDLMLNDGSKHINVVEWKKQSNLSQRVEISRRRSRRCLLMSLALAKTPEQQSQVHELLALVYYDSLQNVVPLYDQRHYVPARDLAWKMFCQNSLKHFEKAFAYKPEWSHPFYLGKLSEKLGYPYEKALSYYCKAASMNPSAVDPVYRIHASRLKLLYTCGRHNLRAIEVVAGYCFRPSTKENVSIILEGACKDASQMFMQYEKTEMPEVVLSESLPKTEALEAAWRLLFDDCIAALEVCVEGELKHFHKARYMLAQGLYCRGEGNDLERAKDELSFCFKSHRSVFTINMWEIDGLVRKGRRKAPGLGGAKKGLELGMPESSRKFITCIRKYILLYLDLCEKTGDFCTLERAYSSIRTDKKFSLCLEDITPVALGRYIQALGVAICREQTLSPGGKGSFEHLLEKMFNLFMDHGSLWSDLAGLPELRSPSTPEFSESTLYSYIHTYLRTLENDNRVDVLEGINEKLRKRFKSPKLANGHCSRVCKHAALAWCRSILTNLASITPLPPEIQATQSVTQAGGSNTDYGLQLIVDLRPDELMNISYEDSNPQRCTEGKLHSLLSRMKNVPVKQATSENMEKAVSMLRFAFNFYRESSCGLLPTGINLYAIPSRLHFQGSFPPSAHSEHASSVEVLDISTPRKLLLWAYTLVHGRYCNILAVVKHCEDNAKVVNLTLNSAS